MTPEKFQSLVEEHKKILYKVSRSYCRNPDDRDDLAQEIVAQLWKSSGSFDGRVRFSTWMYRVALNVAISFWRRERTRTRHLVPGDESLLTVADEGRREPDEIRLLYGFIENLDPLSRALILLYLDGHSYAEIAHVLGVTETNVATKIARLKQAMKEAFHGTVHRS